MPSRSPDTYQRSFERILFIVLSFATGRTYPGMNIRPTSSDGFVSTGPGGEVLPGDLVILQSIRGYNDWLLSWVVEYHFNEGNPYYVLASARTGELTNYYNVGVSYYPRDKLDASWRWTDRQWAFHDRMFKAFQGSGVCDYTRTPRLPSFGEGNSVEISMRARLGISDYVAKRTFPDWRKITKAQMSALFDEMEIEFEFEKNEG